VFAGTPENIEIPHPSQVGIPAAFQQGTCRFDLSRRAAANLRAIPEEWQTEFDRCGIDARVVTV
jgi:hypothetical protein